MRKAVIGFLVVVSLISAGCAGLQRGIAVQRILLTAEGVVSDNPPWSELFVGSDREVEASIDAPPVPEGVLTEWVWSSPDGQVYRREWRLATGGKDVARLPLAGSAASGMPGLWQLQVRNAKGGVLAAAEFHIVADRDEWITQNSEDVYIRVRAWSNLCRRGHFQFMARNFVMGMHELEKTVIVECFKNEEDALEILAERLNATDNDESLQLLAYQVKVDRVGKLTGAPVDKGRLLADLEELLTPWDSIVLRPLLKHSDPQLRAEAARLLGKIVSNEAVLFLDEALGDDERTVRMAAVKALGRHPGLPADETLRRRYDVEQDSGVRDALRQALVEMEGVRQ